MNIGGHAQKALRAFSREIVALWFAFRDPRVRWYAKLCILIPILYVVSPYDLINDSVLFWGQIDDIVVLRISYLIVKKIIDPAILDECRERAAQYLESGPANKLRFAAALILMWGFVLFVVAKYLVHKIVKHS